MKKQEEPANKSMNSALLDNRKAAIQTYSFDILTWGWVRAFARSRYVPLVFQVFMVLIFAYAIYAGFVAGDERGNNFGLIMFWAVFWPSMIMISTVTVGKMWCSICPLGAISAAAQRFGLNSPFPAKVRNGAIALALFIIVVWMVREVFRISDHGYLTAWFFTGFIAAAILVGLLFRDRAWCKNVCPIGIISGLWAMLSFVELRPTKEKCENCSSHECVKGDGKTRGCPMGLYPGRLDSNRDCTYCLNCVKTCPQGSPQIRLRWPGYEIIKGTHRFAIDAGFAIWIPVVLALKENMEHYYTPDFLRAVITWFQGLFNTTNREGIWFAVVVIFNGALLFGAYLVAVRISSRILKWEFKRTFATFGYMFIPIVLVTIGGHALHYFFDTIWGQMVNVVSAPLGIYVYKNPSILNEGWMNLLGHGFATPVLYATGFFTTIALPYKIAVWREANHQKALGASIPFIVIAFLISAYFIWTHMSKTGGPWRW